MESDARAELDEVRRLGAVARQQSHSTSPIIRKAIPIADIAFLGVFALSAWKLPTVAIVLWWGACLAVVAYVRLGRRARPRRWWATEGGRRNAMAYAVILLSVYATWFPLWFWNRGVAVACLAAFIVAMAFVDVSHRRHA
jgi:hypothetical protein